ncbi:MAG: N-acetylmuramoyl-L-alanine amidase [Clostridia bacterium]|nr:N-acetylmuramoyl-L-alanine amidase [Clostridia bacterium]
MDSKALLLSIKILLFSIIMILSALILNELNRQLQKDTGTQVSGSFGERTVFVIDAGHGGEDGGAIGANGCIEKELNLDIALTLYDLLRASDIPAVLTRDEDIMLYDESIPGKKKSQDLKNRLEIADSFENSVLISIHMNSYPSPKYKGAQVYYSVNDQSGKQLAKILQDDFKEILQNENTRQIKPATSAIYLLHNAKKPAVLVECGFISNIEEAELLCNGNYRNKVATVIYSSIVKYITEQRTVK